MGSELDRSALDSKLLANARKSPAEISVLTGLPAEVVAERISVLLESRDWLSERQQERLLLEEITDLKDLVMSQLRAADPEDFVGVANVALRSLKLISERLDSRRKLVEADIATITAEQARIFGRAFDVALQSVVSVLGADAEPEIVDAAVREGLMLAAKTLDDDIAE